MRNASLFASRAQGTIEYLVILAVVIVISLVVVGIVGSNANTQSIASTSGKIGNMTQGSISIADALVATDGNGLISLQNNSGEMLTITGISVDGKDNNYDTQLAFGSKILFSLHDLENACSCSGNEGATKTCNAIIYYATLDGLQKSVNYSVTVDCVQSINALTNPVQPIFVCDNRTAGGYFYIGTGTLVNPYGICDCNMLQDMNHFLDANYILLQDIDCTDTINWNSGTGFKPIGNPMANLGDLPVPFTGKLDGNGRIISNLFIRPPTVAYLGLVGWNSGTITNVGLADVNIKTEYGIAGGIAGRNVGTISNSYVTGVISGATGWDGGIAGISPGVIRNTYSSVSISALEYIGGISGSQGTVINSFSTGQTIAGNIGVAGLIGILGTATNSFAAGSVSGNSSVGGVVGSGSAVNSYWDITRTGQASGGNCSAPDCIGVNSGNSNSAWAYYDTNQPMSSWGTWTNISGNKYSTTDGNWSICRGAGYPWLTWENRSC
ncbi:Uncharacterised protein [uncultured archaeon]|nr:Uncharacterised protein [uncultured archaeon]